MSRIASGFPIGIYHRQDPPEGIPSHRHKPLLILGAGILAHQGHGVEQHQLGIFEVDTMFAAINGVLGRVISMSPYMEFYNQFVTFKARTVKDRTP